MATLHKRGIDPSTVVLAAHSSPGNFSVTVERLKDLPRQDVFTIAGKKLVAAAVEKPAWSVAKEYALHDMKGVARLVEKYMQPSRAIDDDEDDSGRKKIIFVSCDVGTEVDQYDLDPSNQKIQIGVESVVSQLGKDLSKQGVESNVDIYGAPAGIQVARTADGVRYTGQPKDTVNGRTAQHVTRIRLDDGTLTKSDVDEIRLRKSVTN
jgi:ABC-type Zn2+ transport system substrate-binding protein/surface adhesin